MQVWRRCVYHWEPVLITCSCSPSEGTPINAPPLLSHPPPPPPPSHPSLLLPCHMAPSFSSHKILPSITLRPPADISSYLPASDIFSNDMLFYSCLEGSGRSRHFRETSFWEGEIHLCSHPSSSCSSSCNWPGVQSQLKV